MFSYLLGIMAITIYNQMYGSTGIVKIVKQYNDYFPSANFGPLTLTVQSIAIGITLLLYLTDLSAKVTEKNFSIEQFFKATLRCVTSYLFIMNAGDIITYILDISDYLFSKVSETTAGYDFFTGNNRTMFMQGLNSLKIMDILSYIVNCLMPWVLSMIGEVIIQIILISRILEITVMKIFAPLAIADIYKEGTSSNGVTYMKKVLALGLQITVIVLINIATQAIITKIVGASASETMVGILEKTTTADKIDMFTSLSTQKFLDTLTGHSEMMKVLGIMLARVGLIWNSMPLCEEITGAR